MKNKIMYALGVLAVASLSVGTVSAQTAKPAKKAATEHPAKAEKKEVKAAKQHHKKAAAAPKATTK